MVRVVEGLERMLVERWEVGMGTNTEATIASNDTTLTNVATSGDRKLDMERMERMKMMSSVFHLVVTIVMLMMTGSAFI